MESSAVVTPPYVARPLRLAPFHALMLAPRRIGDPSSGRLFARPYRAVASRLKQWQERGQLWRDDESAVYLHEYTAGGLTVRGLVGALDLTRRAATPQERAVLPHEGIHPVQADELADRMTELAMNPAPILLVHRAPAASRHLVHEVMRSAAEHDFLDRNEQRHRVWAIRDPALLDRLDAALADTQVLIADGHHRYAAYLRMQQRRGGGPTDRGLAMLVDQVDTPLFLGPIHRILTGVALDDLEIAVQTSAGRFHSCTREEALSALGPDSLVATDGRSWARVGLDVPPGRAVVELLHEQVIPALPRGPQRIQHHHTVDSTLAQLRRGQGVGILMPAPDVDLVLEIAAADRLLPEKATSFQPKPSVGVLMRSLRDS